MWHTVASFGNRTQAPQLVIVCRENPADPGSRWFLRRTGDIRGPNPLPAAWNCGEVRGNIFRSSKRCIHTHSAANGLVHHVLNMFWWFLLYSYHFLVSYLTNLNQNRRNRMALLSFRVAFSVDNFGCPCLAPWQGTWREEQRGKNNTDSQMWKFIERSGKHTKHGTPHTSEKSRHNKST